MTKVLGLIPARGGSKAIPGKNIKPLGGKSLIQRAWEGAKASGVLDRIVLSTDNPELACHAQVLGIDVPFMRPAAFAQDASPMIDVALHALEALRLQDNYVPEALLLLQPTSPLRTPETIQKAVDMLDGYDAVCSVMALPQDLSPYYLMKVREDGCLDYFMTDGARFTRRQDLPLAYRREGTIFLTRTDVLIAKRSFYGARCRPMLMDPSDVLNIDTVEDWEAAERLFEGRSH